MLSRRGDEGDSKRSWKETDTLGGLSGVGLQCSIHQAQSTMVSGISEYTRLRTFKLSFFFLFLLYFFLFLSFLHFFFLLSFSFLLCLSCCLISFIQFPSILFSLSTFFLFLFLSLLFLVFVSFSSLSICSLLSLVLIATSGSLSLVYVSGDAQASLVPLLKNQGVLTTRQVPYARYSLSILDPRNFNIWAIETEEPKSVPPGTVLRLASITLEKAHRLGGKHS